MKDIGILVIGNLHIEPFTVIKAYPCIEPGFTEQMKPCRTRSRVRIIEMVRRNIHNLVPVFIVVSDILIYRHSVPCIELLHHSEGRVVHHLHPS